MINAKIASLPDGAMGCDVTGPLTLVKAKQLLNKGFTFVIRYVGRNDGSKVFVDISQTEAQAIVDAGLALCVVQHPLKAGWSPTAALGQRFGAAAAELAGAAGLTLGMTVWLDLEGVAKTAQTQDVIDYCNEWYDQVISVGYVPGIYIGANPGLTADELYWDVSMKSYWRGGSSVASGVPADIPNRGYQLTQRINNAGTPTEFDTDVTHADHFGGKVFWCVAD